MKEPKFPYRHRDLNWLTFNDRVLQEAADESNPLYERIKFVAIFSSNLDEFFRVRVSQLRQLKRVKKSLRKKLALKPSKLVKQILEKVQKQQKQLGNIFFDTIVPQLRKNRIELLEYEQLTSNHANAASIYFEDNVKDHVELTKVEASRSSDIFLKNQRLYLLITFADESEYGIASIPTDYLGRFIKIAQSKDLHTYTFLDDILRANLHKLVGKKITGCYSIKLSRDAELYLDQEDGG